jgi:hypothetical protein
MKGLYLPGDLLLLNKNVPAGIFVIPKGTSCVVLTGDSAVEDQFGTLFFSQNLIECSIFFKGKSFTHTFFRKDLIEVSFDERDF